MTEWIRAFDYHSERHVYYPCDTLIRSTGDCQLKGRPLVLLHKRSPSLSSTHTVRHTHSSVLRDKEGTFFSPPSLGPWQPDHESAPRCHDSDPYNLTLATGFFISALYKSSFTIKRWCFVLQAVCFVLFHSFK